MLFIFLISLKSKVRLLQDSWMGQTSVERLHERLDVLRTSFPPPPSWIQDGDAGNDVIQNLGRVFRPPLRRRRKMAALPLPAAILDDLEPEMRSSKMATGSGRAAILRRRRNGDRKTRPKLLLNVTCGAAILDPRWRRRKWHQPGLGASFSIPIEGEVQNGDPSASGGHLGWPHLRNRKWGHPRWPPEAEGPPFCTSPSMGIEKLALYY